MANSMVRVRNIVAPGSLVSWRSPFIPGGWFSGEVVSVSQGEAYVRRSIGGMCLVPLRDLG